MKKKSAFTLIELLVVLAVITLLMAALLPALSAARKRARAVVCLTRLKQWGTTLALYVEDHEGHFPRSYDMFPGLSVLRGLLINPEIGPNRPERSHGVETRGIGCCPMAAKTTEPAMWALSGGQSYLEMSFGGTFLAWQILKPTPAFRASYGLNRNLVATFGMSPLAGRRRAEADAFSLKRGYNIPILLNASGPNCWMAFEDEPPPETEPFGTSGHPFSTTIANGVVVDEDLCINRHSGTLNTLFLDWSVRPVGLKELWALKWHIGFDTAGPWTKTGGVKPEDWPQWMRKFRDY